jgi:hypothetical protein
VRFTIFNDQGNLNSLIHYSSFESIGFLRVLCALCVRRFLVFTIVFGVPFLVRNYFPAKFTHLSCGDRGHGFRQLGWFRLAVTVGQALIPFSSHSEWLMMNI